VRFYPGMVQHDPFAVGIKWSREDPSLEGVDQFKKGSMKTTQLSMNLLRKSKCMVAVVEKWNPFVKIKNKKGVERIGVRQDLFGFADIIAITPTGQFSFIQLTDMTHLSKHRRKILENKNAIELMARGVKVVLHGWKDNGVREKNTGLRYEVHIEEIKAPGRE